MMMKISKDEDENFLTFRSFQNFTDEFYSNKNLSKKFYFKAENDFWLSAVSFLQKFISIGKIF